MSSPLIPDRVCNKVQDITVEWLNSRGITGVLADLDNTLAAYSEELPSAAITEWAAGLTENGIDFMIISNNKSPRVSKYCEKLGIKYLESAHKPKKDGFLKAASMMDKPSAEIAMVGDQIFTDIYGGNRCGMTTIIVSPVKSNIFFAARRMLETPFIRSATEK